QPCHLAYPAMPAPGRAAAAPAHRCSRTAHHRRGPQQPAHGERQRAVAERTPAVRLFPAVRTARMAQGRLFAGHSTELKLGNVAAEAPAGGTVAPGATATARSRSGGDTACPSG